MSSTRHERGTESFPPLKLIFETALLLCRTPFLVKPLRPKKTDTSAIVIRTSGPVSEFGGFFGTNTYEYYGRKTLTQIATHSTNITSLYNSVSTDGYEKQCACCARHACPPSCQPCLFKPSLCLGPRFFATTRQAQRRGIRCFKLCVTRANPPVAGWQCSNPVLLLDLMQKVLILLAVYHS